MAVIVVAGLALYPVISPRVPQVEQAVRRGVSEIQQQIHQPTPAPTLPPAVKWLQPSQGSCSWAEGTLTTDSTLDLEAAKEYPAWQTWYTTVSSWWVQAQSVVKGLCGQGPVPTSLDCQQAIGHFATARATHEAALNGQDPAGEPGTLSSDRAWNEAWAGYYTRLTDIVAQTGCGVSAS